MNNTNFDQNIKFVEKHIGGINDDNLTNFNNQNNIINDYKNDYQRNLEYYKKIERDKNKNDNYVERLDNEKHTSVYRLNNYVTTVDDIIYSNPIIYPKEYDQHFDYLQKKNINPINTQVVKNKSYINIDSSNRNTTVSLNIQKYFNLNDYSLEFIDQSNYFNIYIDDADKYFQNNNYIILRGFQNYVNYYQKFNFFFKNGSPTVILELQPNFLLSIPYYDILIRINGVKSENNLSYYKNIPLELINQLHKVFIISINNDNRLAFNLPINFYSENEIDSTFFSDCEITFYNIGNYPINLINANTPITPLNLSSYLIVNSVTNKYIKILLTSIISINNNINLEGKLINGNFRTGINIQIGIIEGFSPGYPNPNNFSIDLNKTYNNVAELKIVSSEIPNTQKNITISDFNINSLNTTSDVNLNFVQITNNKLYWQNIIDVGIYQIELEQGFYSYDELKLTIENKVSQVKRNCIYSNTNLFEYNIMSVQFIIDTNETKFNLFNLYILPNCLESLTTINNDLNSYLIRINHNNHNLKVGDLIFITGSLNYFFISKDYINTVDGHRIVNVINNNFYDININNINIIPDTGNTKGGFNIKIKTFAIFRLFFNFNDTFGSLMGFRLTGDEYSITNYSESDNNYTISNFDPYYYDISKILIINGNATSSDILTSYSTQTTRYILLLADGLNNNNNPNSISYFYKFLLNGLPNTYLYNTYVASPIYFNPPLRSLKELKFTFINPDGSLVNFGNLDYSITIEITTLSNLPENTNITTFMSRI